MVHGVSFLLVSQQTHDLPLGLFFDWHIRLIHVFKWLHRSLGQMLVVFIKANRHRWFLYDTWLNRWFAVRFASCGGWALGLGSVNILVDDLLLFWIVRHFDGGLLLVLEPGAEDAFVLELLVRVHFEHAVWVHTIYGVRRDHKILLRGLVTFLFWNICGFFNIFKLVEVYFVDARHSFKSIFRHWGLTFLLPLSHILVRRWFVQELRYFIILWSILLVRLLRWINLVHLHARQLWLESLQGSKTTGRRIFRIFLVYLGRWVCCLSPFTAFVFQCLLLKPWTYLKTLFRWICKSRWPS